MAKRYLSERQKSRIQKNQQTRIDRARHNAENSDESLGQEQRGLVTARYARHVDVQLLEGEKTVTGHCCRCNVRATIGSIAVGDRVVWRQNERGEGVVVAVEARRSVIERPDGLGKLKPVAANIDQVFLVFAIEPEPHSTLIDRYLIAAENAHIEAKLVLNKIDLLPGGAISEDLQVLMDTYRDLGYDIFEVSCHKQLGLEAVRQALAGKTSVFAGQSGVGKSSLINALLPELDIRVGELSDAVSKGKHTTTTACLYELPGEAGGYLIDSPGIREFHLSHFTPEQIYAGYRELHDVLGHCRFRDCRHQEEPGCAVKAVIDSGRMRPGRVQSLQFILNSLE